MPMLPDPAHMDIIDKACISAFEAEEPVSVFSLCENIMDDPKLPMHCPYHHYLIPAVLLTAASRISGETEEMLQKERDCILSCEPEDIRALAEYMEAILESGYLCVVGGETKIQENKDLFDVTEALI